MDIGSDDLQLMKSRANYFLYARFSMLKIGKTLNVEIHRWIRHTHIVWRSKRCYVTTVFTNEVDKYSMIRNRSTPKIYFFVQISVGLLCIIPYPPPIHPFPATVYTWLYCGRTLQRETCRANDETVFDCCKLRIYLHTDLLHVAAAPGLRTSSAAAAARRTLIISHARRNAVNIW